MINAILFTLVIGGQNNLKDTIDCGKLKIANEFSYSTYPKLYLKDTSIQVSDDAYISDQKVIFKTKNECIDLGNEFSAEKLAYVSAKFPKMDFARPNSLEDFMDTYFSILAVSKYKSIPAHIAYSKEEGISGERFLVIVKTEKKVINNHWGTYEEYIIPKMECISVDKNGLFHIGDSLRCSQIIKKHLDYTEKWNH